MIQGNIFFKANIRGATFIKLFPAYDAEHGVILKAMMPHHLTTSLDKSWIKMEYDRGNELFRFRCPQFLKHYLGESVVIYEDALPCPGELFRIKKVVNNFSIFKPMLKVPRKVHYDPRFSKDGRLHFSLPFVKNNFPLNVIREPLLSTGALLPEDVTKGKIQVYIISGKDLVENEYVFRFNKTEHELITTPIYPILKMVGGRIERFKYKKREIKGDTVVIHAEYR